MKKDSSLNERKDARRKLPGWIFLLLLALLAAAALVWFLSGAKDFE